MKTNENMVSWKKNTLCLFNIVFAFFTIAGWQVSESSAQDWATCIKPVNIPDEIDVLILGQESEEKTLGNETDDDWFQYYFANEEDDTNPDDTDTNGEDHSIDIQIIDEDFYVENDLSWEVYDRNGICVARGKSTKRFGPSYEELTPPPGADPLPSDTYFIRIIWDPEDDIEFEDGDGDLTYSLTLNGQGVPQVYGIIKDAVNGLELANVRVNSSIHKVDSYDDPAPKGEYMLHAKDNDDVLKYDLDGYQTGEIANFDFEGGIDHLLQNVILCPNDDDVALTATPSSGDPLTVTFDLLPDVTNPEVSADYDWDFGDGMSSVSPDPVSHTYSDPGTYTVDVTVSLTLPQQEVKVNNIEYLTKKVECTVESSVDVNVKDPNKPDIFDDVPTGSFAKDFIEKIYLAGITSGCFQNPLKYCPEKSVTRAEMAVFLERGINGSDYDPDDATGTLFDDVPVSHGFADWIEQFYADGITSGCKTDPPLYCPDNPVTRAQMAVFLLRSMYGEDYTPPPAMGIFDDVPVTHGAANWIEQLYDEGITSGCVADQSEYCPDGLVTRAEMAVFIVRAFEL